MNCENYSAKELFSRIEKLNIGNVKLMEVCGTHTMSIAKSGLRDSLPENITLLSGPGCPVCVTAPEVIDEILSLAKRENVIIATYGDMIKVPGSCFGESLATAKAEGARVEVVYSPFDALDLAGENPDSEVVFLGVGFETTAPGTARAIAEAKKRNLKNFSVFSMIKKVEPALRTLISEDGFEVSGFLCPGHVATIIGADAFSFLADEYKLPCVVGGFEPVEILYAVYRLLLQIESGIPKLENAYPSGATDKGNRLALEAIDEVFTPRCDIWRGLSEIPMSGLKIREEFSEFDAEIKFDIKYEKSDKASPCRCGDVIRGRISPFECPLFGKTCVPENAVGPCMVSSEGACAAYYKYSF